MKKIVILQRVISSYNVPLYRKINELYDVTLAYSQKTESNCDDLKMVSVRYPSYSEFKAVTDEEFQSFMDEMEKLCAGCDVMILPMEPHSRILHIIELLRKRVKVMLWGIGVAASYNTRYDSEEYRAPSFESMICMADAGIFYTPYPVKKYAERCVPKDKMFVAHNTVEVLDAGEGNDEKELFLFVGTLLRQKRVDLLLDAYKKCLEERAQVPDLMIIGAGEEYPVIQTWIEENGLSDKVLLKGALYDEKLLKEYFQRAYAVFSPDQAGLYVLKAMGYGVCFITNRNAITGGEIFNITDGVNGVLYREFSEIKDIMCDIIDHPKKYRQMGKNAYMHYHSCRTIQDCANGFFDALHYVFSQEEGQ